MLLLSFYLFCSRSFFFVDILFVSYRTFRFFRNLFYSFRYKLSVFFSLLFSSDSILSTFPGRCILFHRQLSDSPGNLLRCFPLPGSTRFTLVSAISGSLHNGSGISVFFRWILLFNIRNSNHQRITDIAGIIFYNDHNIFRAL